MKKPQKPCEKCQTQKCGGVRLDKYHCRKYKNFLQRLVSYYEQAEQERDISCRSCPLGYKNMWYEAVRIGKVKAPAGKTVCLAAGKTIATKDCRGHEYPAWCVRNRCLATCLVCGCRLFPIEKYNGVCMKCGAKKKNQHLIFKYR